MSRVSWLCGEAFRNVVGGSARWWLAVPLWLTLFVPAGFFVLEDGAALASVRDAQAGGAFALQVRGSAVDGVRCHSLSGVGRVVTAGAMRDGDPVRVLQLPGTPVRVVEVSEGMLSFFGLSAVDGASLVDDFGGFAVSSALASEVVVDGRLVLVDGDVRQVFVLDEPTVDVVGLDRFVLSVVPFVGEFSSCWVDFWPPEGSDVSDLRLVADLSSVQRVEVEVVSPEWGVGASPSSLFRSVYRTAKWVALVGGVLLGVLLGVLRRRDSVLCRYLGLSRVDLGFVRLVEALLYVVAPCVIVFAGVFVLGVGGVDVLAGRFLVSGVSGVVGCWVLGVVCSSVLSGLLASDRRVFSVLRSSD